MDIGMSVFPVHAVDAQGKVIVRRQLKSRKRRKKMLQTLRRSARRSPGQTCDVHLLLYLHDIRVDLVKQQSRFTWMTTVSCTNKSCTSKSTLRSSPTL